MKYSKQYLDKFFNSTEDYHSMIELLCIANAEFERNENTIPEWFIELSEIMNWQAMSDKSGVWTYYEVANDNSARILINCMKTKNEDEIFNIYTMGIDKFTNESIMDEIDLWIRKNEDKIYKYIENILTNNKDWFYKL